MSRRFIHLLLTAGLLAGCGGPGDAETSITTPAPSTAGVSAAEATARPTTPVPASEAPPTSAAPELTPWTPTSHSLCTDLTQPEALFGADFGYVGTFVPGAVPTACFKFRASRFGGSDPNDGVPCRADLDVLAPYDDGYMGLPLFGLDGERCQQLAAVDRTDIVEVWATLRGAPGGQFLTFEEFGVVDERSHCADEDLATTVSSAEVPSPSPSDVDVSDVVVVGNVALTDRQVEMVGLTKQYLDAWKAGDPNAVAAFFAPEGKLESILYEDEFRISNCTLIDRVQAAMTTFGLSSLESVGPLFVDGNMVHSVAKAGSSQFSSLLVFTDTGPIRLLRHISLNS
jgi:hypothetical protein